MSDIPATDPLFSEEAEKHDDALTPEANILIVDDIRANLRLLAAILAKAGYVVRPVLDGFQALSVIEAELPDLILLDIKMPRISGYEVCKRLKARKRTRDIPVIFISALSEVVDKVRGFSAGGTDFITKPFQAEEVLARVKTHLNMKKLRQRLQEKNEQLRRESAEHKRTAQARAQSEKMYRLLAENARDVIWTMTPGGRFTYVSPSVIELRGYTPEEVMDQSVWEILTSDSFRRIRTLIRGRSENQMYQAEPLALELSCKDGSTVWTEVVTSAIRDSHGSLVSYLGVARNITERKQAEEKLKRYAAELEIAKQQAEAANQAKSEFLANMSHEIRTPLNAILGFAEILEGRITDPSRREYLRSIRSSGKSLLVLINDILDLSKVEAGKLELDYTSFSLRTLFQDMEQIFAPRFAEKNLMFRLEISPDLPPAVLLDEARLRQVLLNLIGNAIKFTEKGHILVSARSRSLQQTPPGIELSLSVEDTGIGIPENQRETVFGPFEQRKGQRHAEYGGTGLGLAISRRLVEMMGGTISVKTREGGGCIFDVVFKRVNIPLPAEPAEGASVSPDMKRLRFEPATLLIADDMKINRKVIKGYLGKHGFRFLEASDGKEALEMATRHRPDVIFMDMKMPVISGYDAARRLKEAEPTCHIPIIAVTALAMKETREHITGLCDGYLARPFNKADLLSELMKFLPHSFTEATGPDAAPAQTASDPARPLSPETLAGLPELLRRLEGDFLDEWKELQDILIINEIEGFANEIIKAGRHSATPR